MSFFDNLKRLFGFSPDRFITDDLDPDEIVMDANGNRYEPDASRQSGRQSATATNSGEPQPLPDIDTAKISADAAAATAGDLADDIAQSGLLDNEDAEQRLLLLKQKIEPALKRAADKAATTTDAQWKKTHDNLAAQIEALNAEKADLNARIADIDAKFKASETQRRAQTEQMRLKDTKVAQAEAEVEQYQLEVKSLQNKIKVIQVKTDDVEYFKNENDRVSEELNKARAKVAALTAELTELKAVEDSPAQLSARLAEATEQIKEHEQKAKDLKQQLDLAVAMTNSFREKLANVTHTPEGAAANEAVELRDKLAAANAQIEQLQAEIDEASQNFEIVEQQLDKVEEFKRRKNERIDSLSAELSERDAAIAKLRQELADSEKARKEADATFSRRLKEISLMYERQLADTKQAPQPPVDIDEAIEPDDVPVEQIPDIAADPEPTAQGDEPEMVIDIDDLLGEDWLQPTPPSEPDATSEEPDGTAANEHPRNRSIPDDPRQMSLF